MLDIENKLIELIKNNQIITIFGHVFPDGDCYGSQIGLKELLKINFPEKQIYALGTGFIKMIPLCGKMDEVSDEIIASSLAIVLDSSTFERVEDQRFSLAKEIFFIDHHVKTINHEPSIILEDKISTTEIIVELAKTFKFKFNSLSATALMLGLITDGGRFLYNPSESEFSNATFLLNNKADLNAIYDILYETTKLDLSFKGYYYSHFKEGKGFLYIIFTKSELESLNISAHKAAINVNLLANCKDYPVWAAFSENEDGTVKAEFRCKQEYDVSSLAIYFNGGGHKCASGCTLSSLSEIDKVLQKLEELVNPFYHEELKAMINAGLLAREEILKIYNTDFQVEIKSDNSPVTLADKAADKMISSYLKEKYPNYAFLTEESIDDKKRLTNRYCFIIDPVDGTKDFVAKNGEFATNIALCKDHEIVVGVVIIPFTGEIYYAIKNHGAYYLKNKDSEPERIHVSNKKDNLTLYLSRFHFTEEEIKQMKLFPKITKYEQHGSSLKACYIAHGKGELHYRLSSGTKEWDIAPIQLIVEEAGGIFIKPDGTRYKFNRDDVYNHEGYIIANCKENILLKK